MKKNLHNIAMTEEQWVIAGTGFFILILLCSALLFPLSLFRDEQVLQDVPEQEVMVEYQESEIDLSQLPVDADEVTSYFEKIISGFQKAGSVGYVSECLDSEGYGVVEYTKINFLEDKRATYLYEKDSEEVRTSETVQVGNQYVEIHPKNVNEISKLFPSREAELASIFEQLFQLFERRTDEEVNFEFSEGNFEARNEEYQFDIFTSNLEEKTGRKLGFTSSNEIWSSPDGNEIRVWVDENGRLKEIKVPIGVGCSHYIVDYNQPMAIEEFGVSSNETTFVDQSVRDSIEAGFAQWDDSDELNYWLNKEECSEEVDSYELVEHNFVEEDIDREEVMEQFNQQISNLLWGTFPSGWEKWVTIRHDESVQGQGETEITAHTFSFDFRSPNFGRVPMYYLGYEMPFSNEIWLRSNDNSVLRIVGEDSQCDVYEYIFESTEDEDAPNFTNLTN
ncbi:hypothetical protein KC717_02855 [Candidatus Dojkabacteria bacterium]|uniref:Uncharacterized protein n=1 Tax=Candidatus Dojkabacteria bacterium TaxID=2099670 RepID=A0A955L7P3_9BACT|nr:hypothetical protein [Candidatus Dojkabacteria bacterium]